jgi:saccharopine dehydrogenase-like NADP-dependent oxidoreductase
MNKVLVLGGYGNFGKLICEHLAQRPDIELIIARRTRSRTDRLCSSLKADHALCQLSSLAIDVQSNSLPQSLHTDGLLTDEAVTWYLEKAQTDEIGVD